MPNTRNLKLGYGGTKSEMARLVKESGILGKAGDELTAKNLDQKVSFDQIIKAINITQQRMGITGTTSKEAASTIEGSVNSMKASWQNLLTAIADDNQDMSKSVNEFVESAVTAAKNLVPRIKTSIDGIKKLINSIVTEVFPKLKREIPELRPLIETFEWFIKNKSLVVGAIQTMVAAFAVNKILTFTKGLTDTAKKLLEVAAGTTAATTATNLNTAAEATNTATKGAATIATGALTAATNLLNAAWKANPIGLVVTGVTALIGVMGILKSKTDEATASEKAQQKALEEQTEQINSNVSAWEELKNSKQKAIDAGNTELSHYASLFDELEGIVDANGRVKKGYEERASFITSTLSEALGIEINTVDGVIQKYGNLKSTIDEVMEKKKAQILLDSQETLYKEAIQGQTEAIKGLNTAQDTLKTKKAEQKDATLELMNAQKNYDEAVKTGAFWAVRGYEQQLTAAQKKMDKVNEEVENAQSNYDKQKNLLSEYAYNIGIYEDNMAKAHAGKYDEMTTVNWNYVKDYQKAGDAEKAQLEDQVKVTETNLNLLKELKDKSGSDIYDSQIKAAEKQLEQQRKDLKAYESATKTGLDATKVQWTNGLDKVLSTITGKNISFKEDGKGNVQMYVDGVATGEKKSKEEMADIVTKTIKEVTKKDKDAKKAGEDLIDGVNNGVKNQDKQNGVFSSIAKFGSSLLSKLKNSLKEKSPSKATKEMGQFLLEGLGIGIEDEEDSLYKQISGVGKNVISALQGELSQNIKLGNIQAELNSSSIKSSAENNYNNVVEAFKDALGQMTIELDDENMGKFIDKTVSRTIYS